MATSPSRAARTKVHEPLDRTTIREALADIEAARLALQRIDLRHLRGDVKTRETVRIVRNDLGDIHTELLQVI